MKKRYETKVAVFLILTRENNGKTEILLQERQNTGYMDGMYDTACSGHLESMESVADATVREAKEEIGITVNKFDLELACIVHPYKEDYFNIFFKTTKYEGTPEIKEPEKCSNLEWFDINNLPSNIISRLKNVIESMNKGSLFDDGDFTFLNDIK